MNKEEALSKLCQYSMCNYKEQIWAPEAKELLDYWSGIDEKIKELQQENKQLKEEKEELKSWLEETENYFEIEYKTTKRDSVYMYYKGAKNAIGDALLKIKELEEGKK